MVADFGKAQRLSRVMRVVTVLAGLSIALLGVGFAGVAVFDPELFGEIVAEHLAKGMSIALTPSAAAVVLVLTCLQLSVLVVALYCLWRMFGAFAAEDPLSARTAVWMRRSGAAFLAGVASGFVIRTAVVAALTLGNPPGQRMIAVSIGSTDLLSVLLAGVLLMVGHIMATAAAIQEDNRAII